ncbi:hypothetical protein BJX64DRAFT_283166 [Aspergillus heterothallicus]
MVKRQDTPEDTVRRQYREYTWRRLQVLIGIGYPGLRNTGEPKIDKLWWGYAEQPDRTYMLDRGKIVGILFFKYFVLVAPPPELEPSDFPPALLFDIRGLHVADEDRRSAPAEFQPQRGTMRFGFFQDELRPDVLRVGFGRASDIQRDYYFCFVKPSGEDKGGGDKSASEEAKTTGESK